MRRCDSWLCSRKDRAQSLRPLRHPAQASSVSRCFPKIAKLRLCETASDCSNRVSRRRWNLTPKDAATVSPRLPSNRGRIQSSPAFPDHSSPLQEDLAHRQGFPEGSRLFWQNRYPSSPSPQTSRRYRQSFGNPLGRLDPFPFPFSALLPKVLAQLLKLGAARQRIRQGSSILWQHILCKLLQNGNLQR